MFHKVEFYEAWGKQLWSNSEFCLDMAGDCTQWYKYGTYINASDAFKKINSLKAPNMMLTARRVTEYRFLGIRIWVTKTTVGLA